MEKVPFASLSLWYGFSSNFVRLEGGEGKVFIGKDKMKKRRVKIKRINDFAVILLEREVEALRRLETLNNPHIPLVYDNFVEKNVPFLVTEYIEGSSLSDLAQEFRNMESKELDRFFSEISSLLAAVHSQEVIHRDISPGNLLREANTGSYHNIDFAVASIGGRCFGVSGKEEYMCPVHKKTSEIYPSSDLYSFGVTVCELLRVPKPHNETLESLVKAFREGGEQQFNEEKKRRKPINQNFPHYLCEVIFKMIKPSIQERY